MRYFTRGCELRADYTLRRSNYAAACCSSPPPSTGGALPQLCLWRQRCIDSSEEQLDREVPEDHADGRLGRALERVLAHVEQGDMTAFEPRAQLGDALAGVGASAVLVDAAERAA